MKTALGAVIKSGIRGPWLRRRQSPDRQSSGDRRPRLFVDVSVIMRHDAQTGIQRVVRAVWSNLLERSGPGFDLIPVFATRAHGYRAASADFMDIEPAQRSSIGPVEAGRGDKFLGLDLSAHLLPAHQRQLASWRSQGTTTHVVIYDLLPIRRPEWFNRTTVRNFKRWIEVVRNHCDQALCISHEVAAELRCFLGATAMKPEIGRICLAGDIEGSLPSRGICENAALVIDRVRNRPNILMVGTIEPRKGYDVALAAFERLWDRDADHAPALVIVGKPGWRTEALQMSIRNHAQMGKRLFWLQNASDEGLASLYQVCSAVLIASRGEGFGLPAIEAAMHGRHALVRDLPVFREQGLANVSYFADDSPARLSESLESILRRSSSPPAASALPRWSDCVTQMLAELGLAGSDDRVPMVNTGCYAAL